MKILITGGAGFIGSHLADELLAHGYSVRVMDGLSPQVHDDGAWPAYLSREVETVPGDVLDRASVEKALAGVDAVYHFAAAVGVGQSMYEIKKYVSNNDLGTAVLLEALIRQPVQKLIVASSMSVYGEGQYRAPDGRLIDPPARSIARLKSHDWELYDDDGNRLEPVPTPESKRPWLASVYALTKYSQEQLCLMIGQAYKIPVVALRFFNVYGPRQALSNPYTGVMAIFASRYLNGNPPLVFEDGLQKRDFVSVHDVAQGCRLALEAWTGAAEVINIGSGTAWSVLEIADLVGKVLQRTDIEPEITGKYRVGDIRHCFADISRARSVIGYEPQVRLEEGLTELAAWLDGQVARDQVETAAVQLAERGLTL